MESRLALRPFARERLVLGLVALATLVVFQPANTQDKTRLALTHALVEHGEVAIDRYGTPTDRARYRGRLYTDKAPGLSLLAVPSVVAVRAAATLAGRRHGPVWSAPKELWFVRVTVIGPFLLLLTWLLGRVAEGIAPGTGAATAVVGALGTMTGALGSILFAHVPAACLCFGAFVLATRRGARGALVAGVVAGAAVLVEYQAGLVVALVAVYVAARHGRRGLGAFAAGALPGAVLLGAYDAAAFGSPFRLSYSYVDGAFAAQQATGFFGIGAPRPSSLLSTLLGERGLLVVSPALAAAAVGLVLLWRRGLRPEAALAAAVVIAYLALEAGYFLPYGGFSPGPRFFAPALPFLLLGLPLALAARPRLVGALSALSVALSIPNALTWASYAPGEPFHPRLPETLWSIGELPRLPGALLVCAAAAVAAVVARPPRDDARARRPPGSPGAVRGRTTGAGGGSGAEARSEIEAIDP